MAVPGAGELAFDEIRPETFRRFTATCLSLRCCFVSYGTGIQILTAKEDEMAELTDAVKKAWENREALIVLTTVDSNGTPNSIYASCVKRYSDNKFVVANNKFQKTKANILAGTRGALLFITKEKKSYQIKGKIDYFTSGEFYDDMKQWLDPKYPGHAAAVLNVEEVYSGADKLV